jgi:6-phosphofructokinase 2
MVAESALPRFGGQATSSRRHGPGRYFREPGTTRGVPDDFYAQAAQIASRRGQRFVLDTSQDALVAALGYGVELIKPSLGEFEYLHGRQMRDPEEQDAAAMEIARSGKARLVAVTMGSEGAILAGADFVLRMPALQVPVRSAVGAGDSFLAAMTLAFSRGAEPLDALAWGTAAGAAAIMGAGTAHAKRADIENLHAQLCAALASR